MLKDVITRSIDLTLFFTAIIFLLLSLFFHVPSLIIFLTLIVSVALLIAIPYADKIPRYTSSLLIIAGVILLITTHATRDLWFQAIGQGMNLLTLFVLVPLLGLPVKYGGYVKVLSQLYQKYVNSLWRLYSLSGLFTLLFGPILNVGAMTMVKDFTPKLHSTSADKALFTSMARSYGLSVCFSPFFATVIFVLSLLQLSWLEVAPYTISFAAVAFFVSCVYEYFLMKRRTPLEFQTSDQLVIQWKKILELVIIFLLIVFATLSLQYFFQFDMTLSVSLVAIFSPVLWSLYLKKIDKLKSNLQLYFHRTLSKVKNEVLLIMSAGFFGQSFMISGYGEYLPFILEFLTGNHVLPLIALLSLSMIVLPLIGVHPMILPIIYSGTLTQVDLPIEVMTLAFIIFTSWSVALNMAPFSASILVLLRGTNYHNYQVSIGWNWYYVVVSYLLIVFMAWMFNITMQ